MKKAAKMLLSWLLVFSMVIPSLSYVIQTQAADSAIKNYDVMTMEQILESDESLTWVIAGDSITHNAGWTAGLNSYGEWMEQYLLTSGRGDDSVVLTGWGGAEIKDYLTEENTPENNGVYEDEGMGIENFITKYNPDVITIKLGMNDRDETKADFITYYKQMLNSLYEICESEYKKIPKVVVLTPSPLASENFLDDSVHGEVSDSVLESTIRQRNALEQIVNEYNATGKNILFCDLRTAFLEEAEDMGEDYVSVFFQDPSDGAIHPNAAGQYCIFKTLSKTLGIYDETKEIFQIQYEDLIYHALYTDSTYEVTYAGEYGKEDTSGAKWTDLVTSNYTWAVAGGAQMAGYDGVVVNRSLLRYLENALRGGSNWKFRGLHVYNLASGEYDMATLAQKYDTLAAERNFEVFMLLPEIPEVYASDYVHSTDAVAAYKENVESLIAKNNEKVVVLWSPLASGDATINGYINDYADAVREIADAENGILFFDANQFMNDNMDVNTSLVNNWFEDGQYLSPLGSVDVARAFYEAAPVSNPGKDELSVHNLRYTSDEKIYKGAYVRDNIVSTASVNGTTVTVDLSAVAAAYPNAALSIKVLPYKTVENYNKAIVNLADVAEVAVSGNVYTFDAPCADLNLAIYGEQDGIIYRFKDIALDVATTNTIEATAPDGVYLNSLEVMSAPAIGFDKDTTSYDVNLYQYQSHVAIRATAQAGLTIKVAGEEVASGAHSQALAVEDGSEVVVEVTDGTETKTYTLKMSRATQPDIIITEVMSDGYAGYTASGNDNYELIEIYNASGKDLNLLDYSVGYKKDYTYNAVNEGNGAEFPYYFIGNNLFVSKETHAGIKEITKYSMYWKDKVEEEPEEVIFKADSTMVIWVKFSPQGTAAERSAYGAKLTYETLIASLEKHKGTHTLSVDVDGTETAVVPKESQIVVAEVKTDMKSGSISSGAKVTAENSQKNWYLENHGLYNTVNQKTRSWLFVLKDTAEVAQNFKVTEAGNDIVSAAKYVRAGSTNKFSNVFSYNYERGMSLVRNEGYINDSLVGKANLSDVMGYSNLTSFGAIEYWQKPVDFEDTKAPEIIDLTSKEATVGKNTTIDLKLKDDTDVRYVAVYARNAGETEYTAYTKDFVLEASVKNEGVAADVKEVAYSCVVADAGDVVEYYAEVVDGNNRVTTLGSAEEPMAIYAVSQVVDEYEVAEAKKYIGKKAPKTTVEGYVFSGWYADKACEATPIESKSDADTYETVYALFVPKEVLGVKAQIVSHLENADATDDATGNIRFVTTVDSEYYQKVGFNISYDADGDGVNSLYKITTNDVYRSLEYMDTTDGSVMEYYPDKEFNELSKYFVAVTLKNVPEAYYDMDIKVTPFWITMDGVTVKGTPQVKRINDRVAELYEAKGSIAYYTALEDAVNVATADSTITVLRDAEVESAMTINTNVTINNRPGRDVTVYRGAGLATINMFDVATSGALTIKGDKDASSIVLDGRTKAEALADTSRDEAAGSTGSMFNNLGNLNLENVTAQYARKTSGSGGVINSGDGTETNVVVTIKNCLFEHNVAQYGGAINNVGSKITARNCHFTDNHSLATDRVNTGKGGGAVNIVANSDATFDGIGTFTSNSANAWGGAIYMTDSKLEIKGYTFDQNEANYAGAIFVDNAKADDTAETSEVKINNSVFTRNATIKINNALGAGGVSYVNGRKVTFTDCKFGGKDAQGTSLGNTSVQYGGVLGINSGAVIKFVGTDSTKAVVENNTAANHGGVFYVRNGSLNISGYQFTNNHSSTLGGVIYTEKNVTITESEFAENTATNGGAIYIAAASIEASVSDSKFTKNQATSGYGGAIYTASTMATEGKYALSVSNCTFGGTSTSEDSYALGNKAVRGGAIWSVTGNVIGENCDFISNKATDRGGALCVTAGGPVSFSGGKFEGNGADVTGGAILKSGAVTLTITGMQFTGNTNTVGTIRNASGTNPILKNCTLGENQTTHGNVTIE